MAGLRLHYYGHSCFELQLPGARILIDPYLRNNPFVKGLPGELRPDLILVTHAHGDHLGDAVEISVSSGAPVLAVNEIALDCRGEGATAIPANLGGVVAYDWGSVKLVPAFHSSSKDGGGSLGVPCGFVIRAGGHSFYHAGDTCLFGDMRLIGEGEVDAYGNGSLLAAMLPVGGRFTMGLDDAVLAAGMLRARYIVPMHYDTFESIEVSTDEFAGKIHASGSGAEPLVIKPGSAHDF